MYVIHPHLLLPFLQGRTVDLKTLTLIEDHGDDDEGDAAPRAAAAAAAAAASTSGGGGGGAAAASSSSAAAAEDANVDEEFERILRESEGN